MSSSGEMKRLISRAKQDSNFSEDSLLGELILALEELLPAKEAYEGELRSQGLPAQAPLQRLITHHRGNAGLAAAFDSLTKLILLYEPSEEEKIAVVEAVYGPGEPEPWQLENAADALLQANRLRSKP